MDIHERLEGKCFPSEIDSTIREYLKESGYFVDNLWHTYDVSNRFECTDEVAHKVLSKVLESDYIMSSIHEAICQVAQDEFNLKFRNDG